MSIRINVTSRNTCELESLDGALARGFLSNDHQKARTSNLSPICTTTPRRRRELTQPLELLQRMDVACVSTAM